MPIVSLIIPAYNGEHFLPDTLRSLERQTLTDWEAIVIDDGSTDATRAMMRNWPDARVRLIENAENMGPVRARNRGVAAARGRYVAGLDQDDLCLPERLARQVAYLEAHPTSRWSGRRHASCATSGCRRCTMRRTRRPR